VASRPATAPASGAAIVAVAPPTEPERAELELELVELELAALALEALALVAGIVEPARSGPRLVSADADDADAPVLPRPLPGRGGRFGPVGSSGTPRA
jgi:hypothetical protein